MARAGAGARGTSVEGAHAVAASLAAGRVESLIVDRRSLGSLGVIIDDAEARGVPYRIVDGLEGLATTQAPQGVIATCRPLPQRTIADAVAAVTPAAIMVLDHVLDPRNVGAIARSAVAAGIGGLVMSGRRAAPLSAAAFKAAAGALEHIVVVEVSSVAAAVDDLKRRQVWTVGLDARGDEALFGLALLTEPVALVVGAEGEGLSRLVRERVDVVASIPIVGPAESLNVSVAAGLAAYEVARARSTES
jgi:23S rRNA (guanosine2251-2'-O)-methyltransferase